MREIEFNLDENPFINFQSARYSMSARVNVEKPDIQCLQELMLKSCGTGVMKMANHFS